MAGTWRATAGVVNGESVQLIGPAAITMTFDGSQLSGTAACNGYGFTVTVEGSEVTIVDGHVNAAGCEPAILALQDVFLGSIGPAATFEISDELLTWKTATGTWTLEYVPPTPDAALVDTAWTLNGVLYEYGGMSTPWIGESSIAFAADGTLTGSTGCRGFTGDWSLDGERVTVTNIELSGSCEGERAEIDGIVERVLGEGFMATVDGEWLRARPHDNLGLDYLANP